MDVTYSPPPEQLPHDELGQRAKRTKFWVMSMPPSLRLPSALRVTRLEQPKYLREYLATKVMSLRSSS